METEDLNKKLSKNNMSHKLRLGAIIIRNGAKTISLLKLRLGDLIRKLLNQGFCKERLMLLVISLTIVKRGSIEPVITHLARGDSP